MVIFCPGDLLSASYDFTTTTLTKQKTKITMKKFQDDVSRWWTHIYPVMPMFFFFLYILKNSRSGEKSLHLPYSQGNLSMWLLNIKIFKTRLFLRSHPTKIELSLLCLITWILLISLSAHICHFKSLVFQFQSDHTLDQNLSTSCPYLLPPQMFIL